MKNTLFIMLSIVVIYSCGNGAGKNSFESFEQEGTEVRIIRQMGQLPADTIQYLPLIGNLAEVKSNDKAFYHLVIGKDLENGDNLKVQELSTLVYKHGNEIHKLTLSVPLSSQYKTIDVKSFEEFATDYGSIKWSVESWYNHFAGLGKSKFLRWEMITQK